MNMHRLVSIAIVSRNEIERQGLKSILIEKSFEVVGAYRDHLDLDLDRFAKDGGTPLVLIDSSTDEESLETCRYVHEHWPSSKIVIIATGCHGQIVLDAFRAGIDGYVFRQVSVDSLAEMLKLVALGEKIIPSQVFFDLDALQKSGNQDTSNVSISDANLSDREVQIMQALIRGEANKIIARSMDISEATVKVHVKSILRKLGVMNRTQAAIWGMGRRISEKQDSKPETYPHRNNRPVHDGPADYGIPSHLA
jgi:two-component system nitrate/nitrite response regulator NarL